MMGDCTREAVRAWVRLERFKELIKDHFYHVSPQKAKENAFM